jgi:hypothetical protein
VSQAFRLDADLLVVRRVALLAVLAALLVAAPADAFRLGVHGSKSRFRDQTGQQTQIHMEFIPWGISLSAPQWYDKLLAAHGPVPMIAFGTTAQNVEKITPRALSRGSGDRFLIVLNRAANRWGKEIYFRPLAEMNGHWNRYCAFNADGSSRGEAYSTKSYRMAFRRIYLILHGGTVDEINARLAESDLPPLRTDRDLPTNSLVRVVWNPQGYGSPNIPRNSANSYYPGNQYVDVVANDLYDIRFNAAWEANAALFKSHPDKPYGIGEWGLWGIDDPAFVRRMASFVRNHPRVEFTVFFEAERGSTFDLGNKPDSRRAYRRNMTPLGD